MPHLLTVTSALVLAGYRAFEGGDASRPLMHWAGVFSVVACMRLASGLYSTASETLP